MSLADSLEALVAEHDRIGSPLRERLGPGLPRDRIESAVEALGLSPPADVVDLFAWHEIRDDPRDDARVTWFWPASPYRLEEAAAAYRRSMQIGGVTPAELDTAIASSGPGSTLTGFWRSDWFPILYASPEEYAVVCPIDGEARAASPVWRANWHPDESFPSAEMAPTLAAFVDRVVELFQAGAYRWDAGQRAIMTVDEVFEARGLGGSLRPWR